MPAVVDAKHAEPGRFRLGGMALKELRALLRDRQLRTQALVVPALIGGLQIWMNPRLLEDLSQSPRHLAAAAYGVGAFVLAGSCSALAHEAPALWLLYTLPQRLTRMLLTKVAVWTTLAAAYACLTAAFFVYRAPSLALGSVPHLLLVLIGLGIYGLIALGIGALSTEPLELELRRRVRPAATYSFMLLAALFTYAVYAPSLWAKFVQLALSALLAFSLWQKLADHLPYLLDPTEAPPPQIAVADGVMAALGFFVLQGVFILLFVDPASPPALGMLYAFAAAGLLVVLVTLIAFYRSGLPDMLRALGLARPVAMRTGASVSALALGVGAGLLSAGVATLYLHAIQRLAPLRDLLEQATQLHARELSVSERWWLALLAIVAAPLFEEFIFRGVLFQGFRRSLSAPLAALTSALVFALVHPAIAAVPVLVMALLAALAYERTRWLATPIAAHMTYNAVIVGTSLLR